MSLPQPQRQPLPISTRTLTALRLLLAAMSVVMVLLFIYTALRRLHFAFEYDWIEDGMLASVRHIRSGLPLYAAPGTAFTPYLYTPIYLYVAAAFSRVMGISYAPLRLLSLLSTLGCFATIYALVWRELRRHLAAFAAVGLFAACYPVVQGAFDLGRVDMLYLWVVLLAFYVTRFGNPALAALLWVCAFQTKQGVLPIALLGIISGVFVDRWQRPRRVLLGIGSFVVALAASILWLNHITRGWYDYYVFATAGGFGWARAQAAHFLTGDLIGACGIAVLIVIAAWLAAPPALRGHAFSFYTLGSVGMILFTGFLRAHRGANVNSLLPLYAWMAVLFGLAYWYRDFTIGFGLALWAAAGSLMVSYTRAKSQAMGVGAPVLAARLSTHTAGAGGARGLRAATARYPWRGDGAEPPRGRRARRQTPLRGQRVYRRSPRRRRPPAQQCAHAAVQRVAARRHTECGRAGHECRGQSRTAHRRPSHLDAAQLPRALSSAGARCGCGRCALYLGAALDLSAVFAAGNRATTGRAPRHNSMHISLEFWPSAA